MEPYQYPYRNKERGDVWNNIAINLNGLDHPRFKVNKRSVRDRLAPGISCEESELDQALEEIVEKEKLADEKSSETKGNEKEEKTAAEEHRKMAMECLSQTKKRKVESETSVSHAKKSRSSSDIVEYLKQKQERESESDQRKEEVVLRKKELEASVEQQKQQNDMMKKFMEQQHQQTQMLLSLLVHKE